MTAVLDATPDAPADDSMHGEDSLASWPARAGAFAVDVLLGVAVIATMALAGPDGAAAELACGGCSPPRPR